MKRNKCKECPWKINNQHNTKFIETNDRLFDIGFKETKHHVCHMIDSDVWKNPTNNNVCIGSLKNSL